MSELEVGPIPEYRRKPGLTTYNVDSAAPSDDRRVRHHRRRALAATGRRMPSGTCCSTGYAPTDPELQRRVAMR
jgi:hypothetical protein